CRGVGWPRLARNWSSNNAAVGNRAYYTVSALCSRDWHSLSPLDLDSGCNRAGSSSVSNRSPLADTSGLVTMAESQPRQHHILPVFYISGFTDRGDARGRVYVFDYLRAKRYRRLPRHVASERDFYRIYEPGRDDYESKRTWQRWKARSRRSWEMCSPPVKLETDRKLGHCCRWVPLLPRETVVLGSAYCAAHRQ